MRFAAASLVLALGLGGCGGSSAPVDPALEQTARDIVAMLGAYDCERLPRYLPAGAEELFDRHIDAALLDTTPDPLERVCFVLGVIDDYPRSETMLVTITAGGPDRPLLVLEEPREGGILGSLFAPEPSRATLALVREGREWKLDPEWALAQVQDLAVHQALRSFALAQDSFYLARDDFTEDPAELETATGTVVTFVRGVAGADSIPGIVHATLGAEAQSVCGSARSRSGELFMIRLEAHGEASYDRGTELQRECPDAPLPLGEW